MILRYFIKYYVPLKKFSILCCLILCLVVAGCRKEESVVPGVPSDDPRQFILGSWTNTDGSYITVLEGEELYRYTTHPGFVTMNFTSDSVCYVKRLPDTPAFWTSYVLDVQDSAGMLLVIEGVGDYHVDGISATAMRLRRSTGTGIEVLKMKRDE